MEKIKEALKRLCSLMTLSGYEKRSRDKLFEIGKPLFDEVYEDSFGSFVFVKRALIENAPKMMIDAHFDRVGMMVTGIKKGGFLSVVNIGGLDCRILPSAEVTVYGKREIYGVISSVPPHLRKATDPKGVPTIEELYIDTGYSEKALEEIVSLGDPVILRGDFTELKNGYVASGSLDDKACVCAAFEMARNADKARLKYDIYVTVSAQEETGKCGAALCAYSIKPDIAIITDVNFGTMEGDSEYETIECGKGASVDVSSLVDRKLTRGIIRMLKEKGVPHQIIAEASYTYTNNELVSVTGEGVPTALMSIPLKSMHTPVETVNLKDIRSLADILLLVAYSDREEL